MNSNEDKVVVLRLDQIDSNPKNAEIFTLDGIDRLAKNISENGLIEYPIVKIKPDGRYELIAGERRCAALRSLGNTEVKCIVRSVPSSEEALQQLLDSNVFARNLTPLDYAKVIKEYTELLKSKRSSAQKGVSTRQQVAEILGISESNVIRYSAILKLIPELQELTSDPSFPYSALRPVSQLSEDKQREFYNKLNIIKDDYLLTHEDDTSFAISRNTVDQILNSINYVNPRSRDSFPNPDIVVSSVNELERIEVFGEEDSNTIGELKSDELNDEDQSEIVERPLDLSQNSLNESDVNSSFIPVSESLDNLSDNLEDKSDNVDSIGRSIEKMLISIRGINGIISVNRRGRSQKVKDEVREYLKRLREYIDEIEDTL